MSIFGDIMSKIFGSGEAQAAQPSPAASAPSTPGAATAQTGGATATAPVGQKVDVEAILNGLAAKQAQRLNWRTSIVDLMKLLNLDSSLQARQQLAGELHYSGDMNDSASMNVWLHKQVMQKLADNGGEVPEDLKN